MSPPEPTTNSRWWYIAANLDGHHERARASRPTGASMTRWSRSRRARSEPNPASRALPTAHPSNRLCATSSAYRSPFSWVRRPAAEAQDFFHAACGAQQRHLVEAAGHELHAEWQSIGADTAGQADWWPADQGPGRLERRIARGLEARGEIRRGRQQERVELGRVLGRFPSAPSPCPRGLK